MSKKTKRQTDHSWVSTTVMMTLLGVSREHLYRLRDRNRFIKGTHYYVLDEDAYRPTYRWHKTRVAETMGVKL